MRGNRSLWAALALLLVFLVLAVFALHSLFANSTSLQASTWSTTISAVSSLALVIVTAVLVGVTAQYVVLTRRLVEVQGDFAGIARGRQRVLSATEVAGEAVKGLGVLREALRLFPLTSSGTPNATAVLGSADLHTLSWQLSYVRASLPLELQEACTLAIEAINLAYGAQVSLYESVRLASIRWMQPALGETQPLALGWDEVRSEYEASPNQPASWDQIADGTCLYQAKLALENLQRRTEEYLARDSTIDGR
jgi:hypothetical protein